jgi:hypothetical protein
MLIIIGTEEDSGQLHPLGGYDHAARHGDTSEWHASGLALLILFFTKLKNC